MPRVNASMLSSATHLTRLDLSSCICEAGILAGKTNLQHLDLSHCQVLRGAAGITELLFHLQHMQLTTLELECTMQDKRGSAAAYSALSASTKLQSLNICWCELPAGLWQHVFPADRQLPRLRHLDIAYVSWAGSAAHLASVAPESSRLVGCCPRLQSLNMLGLQCDTQLADLQALTGLSILHIQAAVADNIDALCRLTQLRVLEVEARNLAEGLLLQLTQLKQLTDLYFHTHGRTSTWLIQVSSALN